MAGMKLPRWTPVHVEWVDSARTEDGWHQPTPAQTAGCITVGMVGRVTKKALTLYLCRDRTNGHVCSGITIPWSAVTSVRELR